MAEFRILISADAKSELWSLPFPLRRQVNHAICRLKYEPRPLSCEAVGSPGAYRLRLHGKVVLYAVDEDERLVRVYAVGDNAVRET